MESVEVKNGVEGIPLPRKPETLLPGVEVDYIDTLTGEDQLPHTD